MAVQNDIEKKSVLVKAKFVKIKESKKYKDDVWGKADVLQQEQYSDCKVDSKALSDDLQDAMSKLNVEGYSVDMITPIVSGNHVSKQGHITSSIRLMGGNEAIEGEGSYGYSYTDSLIILATRVMGFYRASY